VVVGRFGRHRLLVCTGLGLGVVRTPAEPRGARAWYQDVPGGSAFWFSGPNC